MSEEYVPFLTYRGAVDPRSIGGETVEISDDEGNSLFENLQKKKPVKKGRTSKRRRVDPQATKPVATVAPTVVLIDDSDDTPVSTNRNIDTTEFTTNVQNIPGIYAAMNAISQNKKLRSEIRKTTSDLLLDAPLDSPGKTDSCDSVLFIVNSGSGSPPLKFRLLKIDIFDKLLQAFCSCNKCSPDSGVLKWYGITLDKKHTPTDFDMNGEENIDFVFNSNSVIVQQDVAQKLPLEHAPNVASPTTTNDAIVLKVRRGDTTQKFRIKTTDNMRKLLDGYCDRHKLDPSKATLHFDGQPLSLNETPTELDMEDGDLIDVKVS